MDELKTLQKKLEQRARDLDWSRDVKTWDWKRLLLKKSEIKKVSLAEFKKTIRNIREIEKLGVKITTLGETAQAKQKKIFKMLATRNLPNKFSLYSQAVSKSFFVIDVPKDVDAHINLRNELFESWATVIFNIGSRALVTVTDDHGPSPLHFGSVQVYVMAAAGSTVEYAIKNHNLPSNAYYYEALLEKDAQVSFVSLNTLTATYYHHAIRLSHEKFGSQGNVTVTYDCQKSSRSWLFLENDHARPETEGDMVVRALGRDRAWSRIDGWITIGKQGSFTNSYLQEDVLVLSDEATIKAEPNLEIVNNEVKASHGATLASVDEQQLLYLMSRGLSRAQAEQMVVEGFLRGVDKRISHEKIQKYVADYFKG